MTLRAQMHFVNCSSNEKFKNSDTLQALQDRRITAWAIETCQTALLAWPSLWFFLEPGYQPWAPPGHVLLQWQQFVPAAATMYPAVSFCNQSPFKQLGWSPAWNQSQHCYNFGCHQHKLKWQAGLFHRYLGLSYSFHLKCSWLKETWH